MSEEAALVYASFTRRALARAIDWLVLAAPVAALYVADALLRFPVRYTDFFTWKRPLSFDMFLYYDPPGILILFTAYKVLLAYPYFALSESGPWQGTPGKLAAGIKVTDLEGRRVSFGRATGRYFLKSLSTFMLMLGYLLAFSDRRQAWHDFVSKTLVVKRRPRAGEATGRWTSRWMFAWPGAAREGTLVADGPAQDWPRYECFFCRRRSNKEPPGCPNCGALYGYGEVRAMKGLQTVNGIIFTLVGGFVLFTALRLTALEIRHDLRVESWYVWPLIYGFGLLFFAGGVSALAGRNWLMRWLLVLFMGLQDFPLFGQRGKKGR
jgi:uncharacterized RDD family membrane protein YckC